MYFIMFQRGHPGAPGWMPQNGGGIIKQPVDSWIVKMKSRRKKRANFMLAKASVLYWIIAHCSLLALARAALQTPLLFNSPLSLKDACIICGFYVTTLTGLHLCHFRGVDHYRWWSKEHIGLLLRWLPHLVLT